jgi:hypothetical protein
MANPEHLKILNQSVHSLNQWREVNLKITPDLCGANLREAEMAKG